MMQPCTDFLSLPFHSSCSIFGSLGFSVAKSWPILCDSMDCSTPGFPVFLSLLEFAQIRVH